MSSLSEDSDVGYLGESTYDMLTEEDGFTDEIASSVASLDDHDQLSLAETNSLSAFGDDHPSHQEQQESDDSQPIPSFNGLDDGYTDDLDMSCLRGSMMTPPPSNEIDFEEPHDVDGNFVSVSAKLRELNDVESSEIHQTIPREYSNAGLYYTVRQTMAMDMLVLDEPLRVLYVGSSSVAEDITKKIGAALAAGCSNDSCTSSWDTVKSPKFSVVSVSSFGSQSMSPEVELVDTSGLEIVVDTCTSAQTTKHAVTGHSDTISLWLNNNRNILSYSDPDGNTQLECQGWRLPHLAIIFCSEDDSIQAKGTRNVARQFLSRHNVAIMVISQSPLYGKKSDIIPVNTKGLHVCVESPTTDGQEIIHKRIPVDLKTFLNINPRQLNRNLGCVTGLAAGAIPLASITKSTVSGANTSYEKPRGFMTLALEWLNQRFEEQNIKSFLGVIIALLAAGVAIGAGFMLKASPIPEPVIRQFSTTATVSSIASNTLTPALSTASKSTFIQPLPSVANLTRISPTSVSPASVKPEATNTVGFPKAPIINESEKFQIMVIGTNYIVLQPPQSYLLLKKAPRLHVDVIRDGQSVPAEFCKLFNGVHSVYTLQVPRAEAHGQMKVLIWTVSKPIIKEQLQVDFGNGWRSWRAVIDEKIAKTMGNLPKTEDVRSYVEDVVSTLHQQVDELKSELEMKKEKFSGDFCKELWKAMDQTRSIWSRHSQESRKIIRKAQKQAKHVWKQAGKEKKRHDGRFRQFRRQVQT
ncbi:hypothetical protein EX30DRAFT_367724 [Ascodesmis nigricans]|uniref:Uncharacterized protein n=1 Tax=Ascodesmis nigricans TaxID=341454 RepID=A0A4V3SJM4_9PEZI|nr:hypothetical protein EX30DRAFT_367724 [Ascodesmis nigricans]